MGKRASRGSPVRCRPNAEVNFGTRKCPAEDWKRAHDSSVLVSASSRRFIDTHHTRHGQGQGEKFWCKRGSEVKFEEGSSSREICMRLQLELVDQDAELYNM